MRPEGEPAPGEGAPAPNPSLTRQELCAHAEALATELVRWKVWRVEGQTHEHLQEAQAIQALAMALVGLLDDVHGSPASVHTVLAKAVALLGYTLQARGPGPGPQEPSATAAALDDNALFLRTHGLRFEADAPADDP